jgi:hypothetical protein
VALGESVYRAGIRDRGIAACTACHSPSGAGNAPAGFPSLSGQHPEYLAASLRAWRNEDRNNDGETRIMRDVAAHLSDMLETRSAGLKLEIVVEASRNERVADIVRGADAQGMAILVEVLRRIRRSDGHDDDDATIVGMAEMIAATIEGVMVRSLRNPALDRDRAIALVRRIIVFLAKA